MDDKKVQVRITGKNDSRPAFDELQATVEKVGNALKLLGVGLGAREIADGIHQIAERFDSLEKSAQKTGISVEKLQELQYAAKLADVPVETLDTAMARLAKNAGLAAAGTGPAESAFRSLGVTVLDGSGKLRSLDGIVEDVAKRFATMKDGTQKTALAMELIGRGGFQLVPFLNSMQEASKQAKDLGLVMGEDVVRAGAQFNDNLKTLGAQLDVLKARIAGGLLPSLQAYSAELIKIGANKDPGGFSLIGKSLITVVGTVDAMVVGLEMIWVRLKDIGQLASALSQFGNNPAAGAAAFTAYLDQHKRNIKEWEDLNERWKDRMGALFNPTATPAKPRAGGGGGGDPVQDAEQLGVAIGQLASQYDALQKKVDAVTERQKDPMQRQLDEMDKLLASIRAIKAENPDKIFPTLNVMEAQVIKDRIALLEKLDAAWRKVAIDKANENSAIQNILGGKAFVPAAPGGTDFASQMDAIKNSQVYANEQIQKAWEDTRTSAERYARQLELLNALHIKGLDDDTYQRSLKQLQQQYELTGFSLARLGQEGEKAFSQDIGRAIKDMVTGTKDAGKAMADFALSFVADLMKMTLEMEIYYFWQKLTGLISGAFGAGAGAAGGAGGSVGGAFSGGLDESIVPFYASGGSMSAGQPGIVGDAGPELWVPDVSGRIIPNDKLGSMGGGRSPNVQLTVVNQGTPKSAQTSQPAWNDQMKQWHVQLHLDDATTNGPISRGMAGSVGGS